MKNRRYGNRLLEALVLGAVLLLGIVGVASAQEEQPRVLVELPGKEVEIKEEGQDFQVNVVAEGVNNLAAFQISLSYDPSVIKYVKVEEGPFLGSSGREPKCLDPRVEPGNPELVRFNCVTLGAPVSVGGTAGPDGSGVLATITFSPVKGGKTSLELVEGRLIAAEINERGAPVEMETTSVGASLEVASKGGFSWLLWGSVIGVGVVVLAGLAVTAVRLRKGSNGGSANDNLYTFE
jgi:hypothetical protein